MSQIRPTISPLLYPGYTPAQGGESGPAPELSLLAQGPSDAGAVTTSNIFHSLGGPATTLVSDPVAASPILRLQSDTAGSILSGTVAQPGDENSCLKPAEQVSKGAGTVSDLGKAVLERGARAGGRLGHQAGVLGPAAGVVGEAFALPGNYSKMTESLGQAFSPNATTQDKIGAAGATAEFASGGLSLVRDAAEVPGAYLQGSARRQASTAFRQAAPNASRQVVNSASRVAAEQAMQEAGTKAARRATQDAAVKAAQRNGGTLAQGAGVTGRSAAKAALREGGEAASKAAGKAVAKSALKTAAKAGARFVPGLNIAIAAADTAVAAATLADPKASTGKKVTSCITAAGSIVAATNIPIVSQVGAGVSAVSSFIGSFF